MKRAIAGAVAALCMMTAIPALAAEEPPERIVINLASRILTLYQNGQKANMYHICAGKIETPTPVGCFSISEMEINPLWVDPKDHKKRVAPGEQNPLGMRWLGLFDMYGIHGTNNPASIGGYYSNGCIRMHEDDVEQLYEKVDIGTRVDIFYNRLVIERIEGGAVVYYIYPDGYYRQPLNVAMVRRALDEYGLGSFLSDEEILKKIDEEDGAPTFLPRVFNIEINNLWLSSKMVVTEGNERYLPVQSLSTVTKQKYTWTEDNAEVKTALGTASGTKFGNMLYVKFADAKRLFGLTGDFDAEHVMKLYTKDSAAEKSAQEALTLPAQGTSAKDRNDTGTFGEDRNDTALSAKDRPDMEAKAAEPESVFPSRIATTVQGKTK